MAVIKDFVPCNFMAGAIGELSSLLKYVPFSKKNWKVPLSNSFFKPNQTCNSLNINSMENLINMPRNVTREGICDNLRKLGSPQFSVQKCDSEASIFGLEDPFTMGFSLC